MYVMMDVRENNQNIICLKKGEKMKDKHVCLVCGGEHGLDDIHHIQIKGSIKKICKGCVTAIKGFA